MNPEQEYSKQKIQAKWGSSLDGGFLVLPVLLLKRQKELDLDSTELVVLLNLLAAWWDVDRLPFTRAITISKRIGVTPRTVQRCLEKLEKRGLILRIRNTTGHGVEIRVVTEYDLEPTVLKLKQLAEAPEVRLQADIRKKAQHQRVLEKPELA